MSEIDKMTEVKKTAEQIIMAAYKNGGRVYYNEVKHLPDSGGDDVKRILKQYGEIFGAIGYAGFHKYEIDLRGTSFVENNGFEGIKTDRDIRRDNEVLKKENLILQNNELKYKEKIRSQEAVIRWWKFASAVTWFIGLGIGLLFAFLRR